MSGANRLVNQILSEIKQKLNGQVQATVYQDEPIRKPAGYARRSPTSSPAIPKQLRNMKQLAYSFESYRYSREELFYRQGMAVADYEDDYEFDDSFSCYFPTYQVMNIHQLRGYFSWRTKVRHGEVTKTSLSFAYLYLYELVNQIGIQNAAEGFFALKSFWEAYTVLDAQIDQYIRNWLFDYVIYYNLDPKLLEGLSDTTFEESLQILLHYQDSSKEALFGAICPLSPYHMEASKFYRQYPDDVREAVYAVFASLSEYYAKNRKNSLCDKLFGKKSSCAYQIFRSAVFFDRMRYTDYEYNINDIHRYQCQHGKWICEKYFGKQGKSRELGSILRTLDSRMREKYGFKAPIKADPLPKSMLDIIDKEIDRLLEEKKKAAAPQVEIDLSKLQGIRQAADLTRDKLIADEEDDPIVPIAEYDTEEENKGSRYETNGQYTLDFESPNLGGQDPASLEAPKGLPAAGLDDTQLCFLRCLLEGTDYHGLLRERHIMPSVIVDAINEALYGELADTAIEFDGEEPRLVDDYIDVLKGMVGK